MFATRAGAPNPTFSTTLGGRIAFALVVFLASAAALPANPGSGQNGGNSVAVHGVPKTGAELPPGTTTATFFVATNGNDSWSGTLAAPNSKNTNGPFASLAKAQIAVEALRQSNPTTIITVMVRQGTYYLPLSPTNPGTLNFTAADSGTVAAPVTWENYQGETPVVSGGLPVSGWAHVSGALWQAKLPANIQPFESLFYNGQRRLRSRLQSSAAGVGYYMKGGSCISTQSRQIVSASLCNLGTFLRVAGEIAPTGANAGCPSVTNPDGTQSKCLDRFQYNPSDPITKWINLKPSSGNQCKASTSGSYPSGDVEVTLFNAWTVDMMRISCVDTTNQIIYLTGAAQGISVEYNYFGPTAGHRYTIDNTRDAFNAAQSAGQTGVWFLDRSTSPWTLNYLASALENPSTDTVVIPQLGGKIPGTPSTNYIGASLLFANKLKYVTFSGIIFEMDDFIPSSQGFNNDTNESFALPQTVDCESCQNVTFDGLTVRHTSVSGLLVAGTGGNSGSPASNVIIENSAFYDIGASGIRIGHSPSGGDHAAYVPQLITVQNNIVQGYSRVFPSGEGIAMGNGHDVTLQNNDIDDGYHAGISICTRGCSSSQWSANGINIISQYNHIWNIMQGITSDSGALYYNIGSSSGSGTGNQILNNLVHDVTDTSIIDTGVFGSSYGGHGVYLDAQSAGVDVENNVIYHVSSSGFAIPEGQAAGQSANTFSNNIVAFARKSMFTEQTPWPQNCSSTLKVNITHNLFYFDLDDTNGFYPIVGCADSCGMAYNQFQNFKGNLYWRTDGGFSTYPMAFHVLTNPPPPNQASTCTQPAQTKASVWTFLSFSDWQKGSPLVNGSPLQMNEDAGGTVTHNPGFGNTGQASDFLLSSSPVSGFDYAQTNDTINNAGRNNPVIAAPIVPDTFPTYSYTVF
ncbi:MAG: right-handed parallel beta-helix repeat-containing protein [Terriglobales bacterium]